MLTLGLTKYKLQKLQGFSTGFEGPWSKKNPNQTTIKKEIRSHAAYLQELWRGQGVRKLKTPGEGRR